MVTRSTVTLRAARLFESPSTSKIAGITAPRGIPLSPVSPFQSRAAAGALVSGSGVLFTIEFASVGAGTSALTFETDDVRLSDIDGVEIPSTVEDGSITVENPTATLVPSGSNAAATIESRIKEIETMMRENRTKYNKDEGMQAEYRELLTKRQKLEERK